MSNAILTHRITLESAFYDIDAMQVVWHGHYFKYFEIARTALLRRIGYDYPEMRASGFAWPVVECACRYARPIAYGERFTVIASLTEYENRLRIRYEILTPGEGQRICKGYTTQVAVDMTRNETCFVTPCAFQDCVREAIRAEGA